MTTVIEATEKKILSLKLSQIRTDGGTQSRKALCSQTAADYAQAMKDGAEFPPMIVFKDDEGNYWLASGFHRYHAHEQCKHVRVWVDVRTGSIRDAILFSVGANHSHGLQRSNDDKRFAVRMLLSDDEWWERADNWIAEKCYVSHHVVKRVREEMMDEWEEEEKKAKEEEEARQAEAERKAKEAKKTIPASTFGPTPGKKKDERSSVLFGARPNKTADRPRQARAKNGSIRTIKTANQGKTKAVKPVIVETEPKEIKKIERQEVRSLPKWLRQWKRLGRSLEAALAEVRRAWDEIPVAAK